MACPCTSKEELHRAEGAKIRELNTVVNGYNSVIAGRSWNEYYADNREAMQARTHAYYEDHKNDEVFKEANRARARAYKAANIDTIKEKARALAANPETKVKAREYRQANLDSLREKDRTRYAENREAQLERRKQYYSQKKNDAAFMEANRAKARAYTEAHRAELNEKRKVAARAQYAANKDAYNAKQKAWRDKKKAAAALVI